MQAQNQRHFQLVVLAKESSKYRTWGFEWRLKKGADEIHRTAFAGVILSIVLVMVCSWLMPILAWVSRP